MKRDINIKGVIKYIIKGIKYIIKGIKNINKRKGLKISIYKKIISIYKN